MLIDPPFHLQVWLFIKLDYSEALDMIGIEDASATQLIKRVFSLILF